MEAKGRDGNARSRRDAAMPRGFEKHLGRSANRYFGDGYRKSSYEVTSLRLAPEDADTLLGAVSIQYAPDWSMRAGHARTPHVSTLDAIVVAAYTAQAHLSTLTLTPPSIARAWISEIAVRAGARPIDDLRGMTLRAGATVAPTGDSDWMQSELRILMGNLRIRARVEHGPPSRPGLSRGSRLPAAAIQPSVYTTLFRETEHIVRSMKIGRTAMECRVEFAPAAGPPATGLSAAYWPTPTLIDCVAIAGQMAEVVVSAASRESKPSTSSNLWMRNILLETRTPRLPRASLASGSIKKERRFPGETGLRVFETEATVAEVSITASFAEQGGVAAD